jgi:hypothetical protein
MLRKTGENLGNVPEFTSSRGMAAPLAASQNVFLKRKTTFLFWFFGGDEEGSKMRRYEQGVSAKPCWRGAREALGGSEVVWFVRVTSSSKLYT